MTGSEQGKTMTQLDTAETGQRGAGHRDTGAGHRDTGAGTRPACITQAIRDASRPGPWTRGPVLAALALLLGLILLLHA
ncbi:hypothetical protein J7E82_14280 [Arthrobacter sp. ISL-30]|nr:hypothetical protein [Arthrobacter sp. ISL-30]MBT2514657.1 hypothetical protein [Arthrobacter sp. ISL-30]